VCVPSATATQGAGRRFAAHALLVAAAQPTQELSSNEQRGVGGTIKGGELADPGK
jgi:hypothetical protein